MPAVLLRRLKTGPRSNRSYCTSHVGNKTSRGMKTLPVREYLVILTFALFICCLQPNHNPIVSPPIPDCVASPYPRLILNVRQLFPVLSINRVVPCYPDYVPDRFPYLFSTRFTDQFPSRQTLFSRTAKTSSIPVPTPQPNDFQPARPIFTPL